MGYIIYNNEPQQEATFNMLTALVKNADIPQKIKDSFKNYTEVRHHPTTSQVALYIKESDFYWPFIDAGLTQAIKNSIIPNLDSSWFGE